ncbi:hypothetical protein RB201_03295 [Streptomyces sp. S1A(2023)]
MRPRTVWSAVGSGVASGPPRTRYCYVHPLTGQEPRDHVDRDGLFPDEHVRALFGIR